MNSDIRSDENRELESLQIHVPREHLAITCILMTLHGATMYQRKHYRGGTTVYCFAFPPGTQQRPQTTPGSWTLAFPDGFDVSLSEDPSSHHFLSFAEKDRPSDLLCFVKDHPKLSSVTDIATFIDIWPGSNAHRAKIVSWLVLPVGIQQYPPGRPIPQPPPIPLSIPVGLERPATVLIEERSHVRLERLSDLVHLVEKGTPSTMSHYDEQRS
jgi:hypothetical protein